MTPLWPATRVANFVRMYYATYMRDGVDAMPMKAPRMTWEEGISFLARRLHITPAEFKMQNPYIVARILFEPHTLLYDTETVMNSIYIHLFGKNYRAIVQESVEVTASLSIVANSTSS